jgi:hypothetical protein
MAQPTNYQRVGATAFDITESGQPSCGYLSYNGSNQWMQTAAAVNFSATDEMSVFAGVLKRAAAGAFGFIVEHTISASTTNGGFYLAAPGAIVGSTENYTFLTRGTTNPTGFDAVTFTAPHYAVLSSVMDNGAATRALQVLPRVNGVTPTLNAGGAIATGAGNYANAVTYFGARAGTSLYFNGLEFSSIIRGALTSGTLLTRTEQYVARQTPTVNL